MTVPACFAITFHTSSTLGYALCHMPYMLDEKTVWPVALTRQQQEERRASEEKRRKDAFLGSALFQPPVSNQKQEFVTPMLNNCRLPKDVDRCGQ